MKLNGIYPFDSYSTTLQSNFNELTNQKSINKSPSAFNLQSTNNLNRSNENEIKAMNDKMVNDTNLNSNNFPINQLSQLNSLNDEIFKTPFNNLQPIRPTTSIHQHLCNGLGMN